MQAYMYSITTHEFLESVPCFPDPVRSRMEGREVYLLPANATFTAPPAKRTGYTAIWNGSGWAEIEDYRGVQYWPKGATYNSASIEMKELGPLPDGASLTRPEKTADEITAEKEQRKQAEAEAARVPDLEAAVAELGMTSSSDKEESDAAALDLAAYAAELEARIAKLEAKNG